MIKIKLKLKSRKRLIVFILDDQLQLDEFQTALAQVGKIVYFGGLMFSKDNFEYAIIEEKIRRTK